MASRKGKYGHPRFYELLEIESDLHSRKNKDYTKGGDPMGNFKRVGNILSNYPGLDLSKPEVVALVYMLKQLDAFMWMTSQGYEGEVEDRGKRLEDTGVYSKIIRIICEEEANASRCG